MTRRKFTSKFKAKVFLDILKERSTVQLVCNKFTHGNESSFLIQELYLIKAQNPPKVPQKKRGISIKSNWSAESRTWFFKERLEITLLTKRRLMISKDHSTLILSKQCILLKLHRSGLYYKLKGESKLN